MARYRFTADYASDRISARKGAEVDLDGELVAWLDRDVPGIVVPVGDSERQQPKRQNRQQRGKQDRSAE